MMNFESIPLVEITKGLNQFDIKNLALTCKGFKKLLQPFIDEIKAYVSTRANCLSVFITEDFSAYIVKYNFKTMVDDIIKDVVMPNSFRTEKGGDNDVRIRYQKIISSLIHSFKIPILEGDIIRVLDDPAEHNFIEGSDYGVIEPDTDHHHYRFEKGNVVYIDENPSIFCDSFEYELEQYSIFHWSWVIDYVTYHVSSPVNIYFDKGDFSHLEIDNGKFLFKIYNTLDIGYEGNILEYSIVSEKSSTSIINIVFADGKHNIRGVTLPLKN